MCRSLINAHDPTALLSGASGAIRAHGSSLLTEHATAPWPLRSARHPPFFSTNCKWAELCFSRSPTKAQDFTEPLSVASGAAHARGAPSMLMPRTGHRVACTILIQSRDPRERGEVRSKGVFGAAAPKAPAAVPKGKGARRVPAAPKAPAPRRRRPRRAEGARAAPKAPAAAPKAKSRNTILI